MSKFKVEKVRIKRTGAIGKYLGIQSTFHTVQVGAEEPEWFFEAELEGLPEDFLNLSSAGLTTISDYWRRNPNRPQKDRGPK